MTANREAKGDTPRQVYERALALTAYHERFRVFRELNDLIDDIVAKNWHKFNRIAPGEYGGIMHDTRGARYYARDWAEKAAVHEAVVGASTKHVYLPEELTRQFQKWDAMFIESGRQAVELVEKVNAHDD